MISLFLKQTNLSPIQNIGNIVSQKSIFSPEVDFRMVSGTHYQAGDQTMLRQINLSAIMNYIRIEAPISRSTLAKKTGLNKATITSLVSELINRNFIKETGLISNTLGRPSMNLQLNPDAGYIIGAEIGVDFINVIGTDFSPRQVFQSVKKTKPGMSVDEVINLLIEEIKQAQKNCQEIVGGSFLGFALGVPGLVDNEEGTLLFAPNLKWQGIPLKKMLASEFNVPIFIDNEANLATFGEFYFGSAYQCPDILFLSAGIGLGGGILHEAKLLRGTRNLAGELGHITMQPDGEICGCGNRGCWETLVSLHALHRYVRAELETNKDSILWELTGGNLEELTLDMIVSAAHRGDPAASVSFKKMGRYLGIGIASLINSLNPDLVVFGGTMSCAWEFLEPVVISEINARALYWNRENTKVVLAKHGIDACVMGGVATVYQAILAQPTAESIENQTSSKFD